VRSRCVPTRPERREHGAGCLAPACERPLPSQRPPATVPALWSRGLAGPALSADPPGLGESRRMGSARAAGDLGPACLSAGAPVRERRPLRAGPPGPAGAPPGERAGGPPRGRSRCALAPGAWAPRARPPRGRALCPAPNLGRGGGQQRHRRAWPQRAWTGPGRIWRGRWRPMRSRTAPAVCSRRSSSAAPSGASLTGGLTLPPTTTSGRCAGGSQQPWWPAAGPSAVSPPMARRALLPPAARSAGRGGLTAARCLASPRWAKRGGGGGQGPAGRGRPTTPTAPRAAPHASGPAGGPHPKAAGSPTRRVMHGALSLRPTAPAHKRTPAPVARQPWLAPGRRAPGSQGPRVRARRSALSAPDRAGQPRHTAASAPAGPPGGGAPEDTLCPHVGTGPHVSRGHAAARHLTGGGAGPPALAPEAKACLVGADASAAPDAPGVG
jgi:hypothetical protein